MRIGRFVGMFQEIIHRCSSTPCNTRVNAGDCDNRPMVLPLKEVLKRYIAHRRDVAMRRCRFELQSSGENSHLRGPSHCLGQY